MRRERAERMRKRIGESMELLGFGLRREVRQIVAMVGADAVAAWSDHYRAIGCAIVMRPWGAEAWR